MGEGGLGGFGAAGLLDFIDLSLCLLTYLPRY